MENIKETRGTYGAGTTYINKKSGRWIAQVYTPAADGMNKKRITGYGETEAKAVRDRNKKVKEFQEKQQQMKEQLQFKQGHADSLQEYTEKWLNTNCKMNVEITTYENYCYYFNTHIKGSWLGQMPMDKITDQDIINYYNEKLENGRSHGKGGLSARSVNYLRFLIKGSLRRAYDKGLIPLNPHADVRKVKSLEDNEDDEIHPLLPDEIEEFKQVLTENENRLKYLFLFTLGSGVRKGEATSIFWKDVDFKNNTVSINTNLAFTKMQPKDENTGKSRALIKKTKTKASKRVIHLNISLMNCLLKQKEQQEKEKVLYKDIYTDKGLVFASETGDYLSHRKALDEVKKVYKLAGISTTHTFHDLRHTFCSILIYKNVDVKTISELMGHSSITITLDVYGTIFKEMAAKTMNEVDDILNLKI